MKCCRGWWHGATGELRHQQLQRVLLGWIPDDGLPSTSRARYVRPVQRNTLEQCPPGAEHGPGEALSLQPCIQTGAPQAQGTNGCADALPVGFLMVFQCLYLGSLQKARLDLVCPVAGSGNVISYRGCDVTPGALPARCARSSTGCLLVLLPHNSTS